MSSSSWLDEQFCWIFDPISSEIGTSVGHQISDFSFTNPVDEQFSWVDDSNLSEVDEDGGDLISDLFPGNEFDSDFEKLNELFMWSDESKLPEVGGSEYSGYSFDRAFETGNEQFQFRWVDDSELSEVRCSGGHQISGFDMVFEKLNELFQWSDDSELSDVGGSGGHQVNDLFSENNFDPVFGNLNEQFLWDDDIESTREVLTLQSGRFDDDFTKINDSLRRLTFEPDARVQKKEPEREKEDVYLICRKDAIEMMGTATRLTKASKDAKLRGDHTSAKQYSQKAREAWKAAHGLNAEAACKILKIKNKKNGMMKLDLHGLHASEAIQAVKKRLSMIETKSEALRASYPDGCDMGKRQCLEVITGVGKHSRGVATLPTAVRKFLADKGYEFGEGRPGVIMVRPKFRAI